MIQHFCARHELSTDDPYDVWKTSLGVWVKDLYNRRRFSGTVPAALLAAFDLFINNRRRMFYAPQEYPAVRALAALSLLNLGGGNGAERCLDYARAHLKWLQEHSCTGYSGCCWGLGFPYPVTSRIFYGANTPLATMTPYALEAFVAYYALTREEWARRVIRSVYDFFERDIRVMRDTGEAMATSYGPCEDRIVINAVSYAMYSYALLLPFIAPEQCVEARKKIAKLYRFVALDQKTDGSWLYSPDGPSFIDCFHSCIVLKNIVKTDRILPLEGSAEVVQKGYRYIVENFRDARSGLFKRFTLANKPGAVKFDLYDNAEVLNVAVLLGDRRLAGALVPAILRAFCDGQDVYSHIDIFGRRRNRNTLRWAVMPFMYALSQLT